MSVEEQMLISAVRYALGRQSYIVGTTAEYVNTIRKKLSTNCLNIIIRDIQEEKEFYNRSGHTLGSDFDEQTWENLKEVLQKEVEGRNDTKGESNS